MHFACVLFDLDGTLIDHFKAIHRCHAYAMRQLGLPEPTLAQVRAAVGGGLDEAIAKLAGPDMVAALLPHFLEHWQKTNLDDVEALPGAREILQSLRAAGATCAVLTNKRGYAAREVCQHLGLAPLLQAVIGVGDTAWIKPQPEFTRHALLQLGANAGNTVLVGDSPFDIATARNGGLAFVGVTTGTHTAAELKADGAGRVVADLAGVARELGLELAPVTPRS
jgi:phosphoglycolate phosphatase